MMRVLALCSALICATAAMGAENMLVLTPKGHEVLEIPVKEASIRLIFQARPDGAFEDEIAVDFWIDAHRHEDDAFAGMSPRVYAHTGFSVPLLLAKDKGAGLLDGHVLTENKTPPVYDAAVNLYTFEHSGLARLDARFSFLGDDQYSLTISGLGEYGDQVNASATARLSALSVRGIPLALKSGAVERVMALFPTAGGTAVWYDDSPEPGLSTLVLPFQ